jgi:exosome complex component RRP42
MAREDIIWELRAQEVLQNMKQKKRVDGRGLNDYRAISIDTNISDNAEGSARVTIGKSQVATGVKMIPGTPYPDSPDQGTISVGVELVPLASPEFETGPPRENAIELSRVVDRGIREAKTIDFKKLSITAGELCWIVFIDGYVLNDDGNLFDTASLAGIKALLDCKVPKLEDGKIVKGEFDGKLEINHIPVETTFAKIGEEIVLDPNTAEEKAMSARLTIATFEGKKISAMQKGGLGSFTAKEVESCIDLALEKGDELRKHLKK